MLIYNFHERLLIYTQVAFIMFTHLHSYLKLGVFAESDVAHSYEHTVTHSKTRFLYNQEIHIPLHQTQIIN